MADGTTLARLTEILARHRLEEAQQLCEVAHRILMEIPEVAGRANGFTTSAESRAREAMTLAQSIGQDIREHFRPQVSVTQVVDAVLLGQVREAKGKAGQE